MNYDIYRKDSKSVKEEKIKKKKIFRKKIKNKCMRIRNNKEITKRKIEEKENKRIHKNGRNYRYRK